MEFNPVKEEVDGVKAKRMIWSSKAIDLAIKGLSQGRKLVANPFYENNLKLLKGDLVFQRTKEEIDEWLKCKNDILYFAEKYCKLLTPEGIKHIKLRLYQRKYLKHLEDTQLSIYLACRQCGKTTTSAIFMLHYILFNVDKNALVLGNKRKTAVEILDKVKKIFNEIPFFLKPGIYKWNEAEIVLDNGCRCMAEATTINSGISFTFHCVLADEFAHIAPNILDKFYNNLFPTITAGKAKFIITSTQNGYNLFYKLYKAAEAGENDYKPFKTDWYEVPEWNPETRSWDVRDEVWHQRQIANYGSEEAFNAQFGTNFDISANTLIAQAVLNKKQAEDLFEFVDKDIYGVPHSDLFKWHPNFEPMGELKNNYIIITVDIAEGIGSDSTIFKFNKMVKTADNDVILECIGFFEADKISRSDCALALQILVCLYCHPDRTLLSIEFNTYGELLIRDMFDHMEKYKLVGSKFDPGIFVKYYSESGTRYKLGIKITPGNKTTHCLLFKEDYERNKIINKCSQFMRQLANFSDDGTGHYKAAFGHDDLVMAEVQLTFVKETLQYKLMKEEFLYNFENISQQDSMYYNPFETTSFNPESLLPGTLYENNESRLNKFA